MNELGYNDSEYMATLPDLKMLVEMYEKYEKEREIYLKIIHGRTRNRCRI